MILDWISILAYPNLFGIKVFVVVVGLNVLMPDREAHKYTLLTITVMVKF
jgi:hypothetical protein